LTSSIVARPAALIRNGSEVFRRRLLPGHAKPHDRTARDSQFQNFIANTRLHAAKRFSAEISFPRSPAGFPEGPPCETTECQDAVRAHAAPVSSARRKDVYAGEAPPRQNNQVSHDLPRTDRFQGLAFNGGNINPVAEGADTAL
jgi:hypothetical protein